MTFGKIGARKMMNTAWINPYVKDGLVAMWDGIWNVGGGQEHDNSSKIWWDCIGGRPIIFMGDISSFGETGVEQGLATSASQQMVGAAFGDSASYGWRFAEYVITPGSDTSTNTPYVLAIGRRGIWLNFSGQNVGVTNAIDNSWHVPSAITKGDAFSVSVDYGSDGVQEKGSSVWYNGDGITHTGNIDAWNSTTYQPYAIASFYSVSYVFAGTFHAIRLYSRALTQSEIDANHALDVQRFGLTA